MSRIPSEISKFVIIAKTIWGAFAGSHCILATIAFSQLIQINQKPNQLIFFVLVTTSIGMVLATSLIRMKFIKPLIAETPQKIQGEPEASRKLQIFQEFWGKYFPLFIGSLALCEAVSLCGFVVLISTGDSANSIPFFFLGFLMHLKQFPFELSRENWEKTF